MLDLYLGELERRARWTLASREVERLLADSREHLDASIQACLEMGDAPDVAERNAIVAFGRVKDIVRGANALHRTRFQGVFLSWTTLAGLGWAFAILASPMLDRVVVVMTGAVFFTMLACFVEGSKVRQPLAPVLRATVAFWLVFTSVCAWWIRDFSVGGGLQAHPGGPVDLVHAALWSAVASAVFFAYLLLAYRMSRPAGRRRSHV